MKKVAKLVAYSFMTRVLVDENATDEQIIDASKQMIKLKVQDELSENLESIEDDEECPIGTMDTDFPSIDRVILNVEEKQYIMIGKGIPVQVRSFDSFSDWDSIVDNNDAPVFDVQIDDDRGCDEPYQFQYVDLIYDFDEGDYIVGSDYQGVKVEVVTNSLTQVIADLFNVNTK